MIDFRAHGNSEGSECSVGIKEAKDVKKLPMTMLAAAAKKYCVVWNSGWAQPPLQLGDERLCIHSTLENNFEMPFATMHDAMCVKYEPACWNRLAHCLLSGRYLKRGMEFRISLRNMQKINRLYCCNGAREDNRVFKQETDEIFANLVSSNKTPGGIRWCRPRKSLQNARNNGRKV